MLGNKISVHRQGSKKVPLHCTGWQKCTDTLYPLHLSVPSVIEKQILPFQMWHFIGYSFNQNRGTD